MTFYFIMKKHPRQFTIKWYSVFSLNSTLSDNPALDCEPQECLVLDGLFGRQGCLKKIIEAYFTYNKSTHFKC